MFFPIKLRLLAFNFEDRPRERKQILKKKFKKITDLLRCAD